MLSIHTVPEHPSPLQAQAQSLFRLYGDFLRNTQGHSCFVDFAAFDEETRTLPTPYTTYHGELLLALRDDSPAACIAFRSLPHEPSTAEIKRLFVHPDQRGHGLARILATEALQRIATRTFTRAILDTDVVHMPAAFALYTALGFSEYAPRRSTVAFLARPILQPSA